MNTVMNLQVSKKAGISSPAYLLPSSDEGLYCMELRLMSGMCWEGVFLPPPPPVNQFIVPVTWIMSSMSSRQAVQSWVYCPSRYQGYMDLVCVKLLAPLKVHTMKTLWTVFAANSKISNYYFALWAWSLWDAPAILRGSSEGLIGRAGQGHEHGIENFCFLV